MANVQNLLNTRWCLGLAFILARLLPPRTGYRLSDWFSERLAAQADSDLVRTLRANQWVAGGERLSAPELQAAAGEVLRNMGRGLYDFYHLRPHPDTLRERVVFSDEAAAVLGRSRDGAGGTLMVAPHMSNFDLAVLAAVQFGVRMRLLTINHTHSGYRRQDKIRRHPAVEVTPMSMQALRQAARVLADGGTVATGGDMPVPSSRYRPRFFGRPAAMPVHHTYLSIKAGVPIRVFSVRSVNGGRYEVDASAPIEPPSGADLEANLLRGAETVLETLAARIRETPRQWAMFHPVWPEALAQMPA
jgi:KDO2-lipid IV(A) lauroyltransferase